MLGKGAAAGKRALSDGLRYAPTLCDNRTILRFLIDMDTDSPAALAKRDTIAGLDKGLQVIEAFDQDRSRLTIA